MTNEDLPQPPPESGAKPPKREPIIIVGKDGTRRGIATSDGSLDYTPAINSPPGNLPITPPTDGSEKNN